jgi:mannose-6-phosphate isomerase-like protein (cupin superfamily)
VSRRDELSIASLLNRTLQPEGGSIVVAEWTAPGSGASREPIAPYHVHHEDDEIWYVLEGSLGFSFDDEEFEIGAGGAAYARAGVVHTYWNASPGETRYLLIMSNRINDLIATLHDPERRGERTMIEVFRDHASEVIADSLPE